MRRPERAMLLLASLIVLHAQPAAGQDVKANRPPGPMTDAFDWMQFANGEWLKGEIVDLQDDRFVFESDELDELSLDWDDIHLLYSDRPNTVMLRDRSTFEGALRVDGDDVIVTTEEGERRFSRDEIRSIIPGRETELNYWSGKLSLGTTVRRGNVDQTDVAAFAEAERRDAESRLRFEFSGTFSSVDDETTEETLRALSNYDIYVTDRLFVRPIRIVYFRDPFQNIDYRITPSAGFGYDVIDEDGLSWTVGAGAGWEFTRFDEAVAGRSSERNAAVGLLSTRFNWEATEKVDVGLEIDATAPLEDAADYNFRAKAYTEVDVWGDLDLEVQVIWDRINEPEPLNDDTTPDPNDLRIFVGIGWSF